MSGFVWLVPVALLMGVFGLGAFLWSMRDGQYDDLDGAAERIFIDTEIDRPLTDPGKADRSASEADPKQQRQKSPDQRKRMT